MTPALAAANFRDSAWNASALLSPDFHLTQNENRHFTLCFQGRGDFHTSKKWGTSNKLREGLSD